MNKHIIRLAIAGAGIVAGVCFAFVAGMKTQEAIEEKYPDPEERPTLIEKAKVAIPIFIPALCALFIAGGTLAAEVTGTQKGGRRNKNSPKRYLTEERPDKGSVYQI